MWVQGVGPGVDPGVGPGGGSRGWVQEVGPGGGSRGWVQGVGPGEGPGVGPGGGSRGWAQGWVQGVGPWGGSRGGSRGYHPRNPFRRGQGSKCSSLENRAFFTGVGGRTGRGPWTPWNPQGKLRTSLRVHARFQPFFEGVTHGFQALESISDSLGGSCIFLGGGEGATGRGFLVPSKESRGYTTQNTITQQMLIRSTLLRAAI